MKNTKVNSFRQFATSSENEIEFIIKKVYYKSHFEAFFPPRLTTLNVVLRSDSGFPAQELNIAERPNDICRW